MLISVFPLAMYNALGDAVAISQAYFFIGIGSLIVGLLVPALNKRIPRRWLYSFGTLCFIAGALLASLGTPMTLIFGLMLNSFATVITFICFNAYVLDYIKRIELGRSETLRLLYSALGWTLGPAVGVALRATESGRRERQKRRDMTLAEFNESHRSGLKPVEQ